MKLIITNQYKNSELIKSQISITNKNEQTYQSTFICLGYRDNCYCYVWKVQMSQIQLQAIANTCLNHMILSVLFLMLNRPHKINCQHFSLHRPKLHHQNQRCQFLFNKHVTFKTSLNAQPFLKHFSYHVS